MRRPLLRQHWAAIPSDAWDENEEWRPIWESWRRASDDNDISLGRTYHTCNNKRVIGLRGKYANTNFHFQYFWIGSAWVSHKLLGKYDPKFVFILWPHDTNINQLSQAWHTGLSTQLCVKTPQTLFPPSKHWSKMGSCHVLVSHSGSPPSAYSDFYFESIQSFYLLAHRCFKLRNFGTVFEKFLVSTVRCRCWSLSPRPEAIAASFMSAAVSRGKHVGFNSIEMIYLS